jgi:diguanylate cyclase (GGDEF)-like protein/hemerythrin-like metal-binding protein/PAS domain S-box-containing protein
MINLVEVFPWNDNFATGLVEIDEQHKKLVQLLNHLASHLASQSDIPTLDSVFSEMAEYAVYHFQTEEAVWARFFPEQAGETQEHQNVHNSFVSAISDLRAEENCKPLHEVLEDILSFLTHWLAFHILESDRRMAKVVLAMQAGVPLEQARRQADADMSGTAKILIETVLSMYDSLSSRTLQLMREISERQKAEAKLRLAANVFDNTLEAICITDAQANLIDANPAFCLATQYSHGELMGQNLKTIKSGLNEAALSALIWQALAEEGHWSGEVWSRIQSGAIEAEWLTLSSIKNAQGEVDNYVGVFSNVSQLLQRQRQLERIANHDALTGLPNRLLLADRLELAIAHARRTHGLFALCYLDLDGFKTVNDRLGHAAGDQLLREIAQRLKRAVRGSDTVARLGGDEFVVVLGDLKQPEDCKIWLDRLLREVKRPVSFQQELATVAASIGVAVFHLDGSDAESLLQAADQAMYQAKRLGKSRYCFFDPSAPVLDQEYRPL